MEELKILKNLLSPFCINIYKQIFLHSFILVKAFQSSAVRHEMIYKN